MNRWSDGIAQIAEAGRIFVGTTLSLLIVGWQCLPTLAAEVQKGTPETPSSAGAVAGTYICHDGAAYYVRLTLNTNGTYLKAAELRRPVLPSLPPTCMLPCEPTSLREEI